MEDTGIHSGQEAVIPSVLERMARAMCDGKWDAADFCETPGGEEPEDQREYWRGKARAALLAIREPDMSAPIFADCDRHEVRNFTAMIDAILAESPQ